MSRKLFTEEQLQLLRKNPYVYSVTNARLQLTKEFKEIFLSLYNEGESPRQILVSHGFDIDVIGERRIWSISHHIRSEYQKYGELQEGYCPRNTDHTLRADQPATAEDELKKLKHEVDYLRQEVEFLKKISSIKNARKQVHCS